jgi:hypothetical protein
MMPWSLRSSLLFAAKFVVVFALLAIPWRWLGSAYALGFSLVSTVALEAVVDASEFSVRFAPTKADGDLAPGDEWGVRFTGVNVATGVQTTTAIEARELGYLPWATLVAIVLASTLPWRRRRGIFLWGSLVLGVRLALAIGLPVAHYVGALTPGSALDVAGRVAFWSLIEPPDMTYAAPVLAFLLGLFLTASPARPPSPADVVRT